MPVDPALGKQLADLGGFALFLLHIAIDGLGLLRQWWVPGWLYRALEAEVVDLRKENRELRKTVTLLTGQLASERKRRSSDA